MIFLTIFTNTLLIIQTAFTSPWVLISIVLSVMNFILIAIIVLLQKKKSKIHGEHKQMQQQYIAKVDMIRKDQAEKLENIRKETNRKDDDRNRQWIESERETLQILNGLSIILDRNDNLGRIETEKILSEIRDIEKKIIDKLNNISVDE